VATGSAGGSGQCRMIDGHLTRANRKNCCAKYALCPTERLGDGHLWTSWAATTYVGVHGTRYGMFLVGNPKRGSPNPLGRIRPRLSYIPWLPYQPSGHEFSRRGSRLCSEMTATSHSTEMGLRHAIQRFPQQPPGGIP
jgi:hypothetical protein